MTDAAINPLVAPRIDSTRWYSGLGLIEDIADTVAGIESGSWIDSAIGGVATSLDTLATVLDPLGSLVSWGVGWLLEHVKPLSDVLDWLAGDPDQVTAYAQTWRNIAAESTGTAADLQSATNGSYRRRPPVSGCVMTRAFPALRRSGSWPFAPMWRWNGSAGRRWSTRS